MPRELHPVSPDTAVQIRRLTPEELAKWKQTAPELDTFLQQTADSTLFNVNQALSLLGLPPSPKLQYFTTRIGRSRKSI